MMLIDPKLSSELKRGSMKVNMEKGELECLIMNVKLDQIQRELKLMKQSLHALHARERRRSIV